MKILLTGGTGFLGMHLASALLARDHQVHLMGRNFARAGELIEAGAVPVMCDLRDRSAVQQACSGMDVVYTGTRQLPNMIVTRALRENVDVIGLSMLSGSHKELCSQIMSMLKEQTAKEIPIVLGGVIPDCDIPELKSMGIKEVFGPGTRLDQIINCVNRLASNRKDI